LRDSARAGTFLQQVLDTLQGQGLTLLSKGGIGADDKITGNHEADRNADQYVRSELAQFHIQSPASAMSQKFAKEVGGLPTVMPAKAGIQKHLIFLDSGSRQL
jgi:hypothetical protein